MSETTVTGGTTITSGSGSAMVNNGVLVDDSSGDNVIYASGASTVFAAAGDTVLGTGATDLIGASSGETNFSISGAASTVTGGSGDISGTVSGAYSALYGGTGNSLFKVTGDNILVMAGTSGVTGADLSQTTGPEEVATNQNGGSGELIATFGSGADTVIGGGGASTVTAGSGTDVFGFVNGHAGGTEVIIGFNSKDVLTFSGYGYSGANTPTERVENGSDVITLYDGTTITLEGVNHTLGGGFGTFSGDGITLPCYLRGTRILTADGEVPVEDLRVGTLVRTASGALRPVVWMGHRRANISRHPEPAKVWPVLIARGAFGAGVPARDLYVSPEHAIFTGGVLILAEKLVNGVTVKQVPHDVVEYWHVELESHDIILAENLPAETYLDTGNRGAFVEDGAFLQLHPDFGPKHWSETCVPLVFGGAALEEARALLLTRAETLGLVVPHADETRVVA